MENQNSATKVMLMYGLILGAISVLLNLITYSFGDPYFQYKSSSMNADSKVFSIIIGVLGFISTVLIIIYAIKAFKSANNGFLTLGQAIKLGLGITLISAIISIIYQLIFMNLIEPEFVNNAVIFTEEKLMETNPDMPEEALEMTLNWTRKMLSPLFLIGVSIVFSLFIGLIISLIAGLIMKKEETAF